MELCVFCVFLSSMYACLFTASRTVSGATRVYILGQKENINFRISFGFCSTTFFLGGLVPCSCLSPPSLITILSFSLSHGRPKPILTPFHPAFLRREPKSRGYLKSPMFQRE